MAPLLHNEGAQNGAGLITEKIQNSFTSARWNLLIEK